MDSEMKAFGRLLEDAMTRRGLKGNDLAQAWGISESQVSNWLRGKKANPPTPELFGRMWRLLGVSPRTLIEALGYLDPEAPEPGIAYAVPEGSARAELLDALLGASDDDVATITAIARLVPMAGLQGRAGMAQSPKGTQSNRSA